MIDVARETLIPVTRAPLPGPAATKWRWAMRGVHGVKLESVVVGGQRFTSREACQRFVAQLNSAPPPQPESQAKRANDAGERLAALGA